MSGPDGLVRVLVSSPIRANLEMGYVVDWVDLLLTGVARGFGDGRALETETSRATKLTQSPLSLTNRPRSITQIITWCRVPRASSRADLGGLHLYRRSGAGENPIELSAYALHATDHKIMVPANALVHNPRYVVESSA